MKLLIEKMYQTPHEGQTLLVLVYRRKQQTKKIADQKIADQNKGLHRFNHQNFPYDQQLATSN